MMNKINACYQAATSYPDLARRLREIGMESYTVDTATGTILYRFAQGENVLHLGNANREIAMSFSEDLTIQAVRNNQQGKTDYAGFMDEIAQAGVRFYEATLIGPRKRVTYIGSGGFYEELIPQKLI
ncbi:DUF1398 domain-containing protein [Flavobacterium sp. CYK-4]|uniref:DUF1398 family protein n=1 Tax=Flavobacterium lotistagni TaxID=2709660 RepID=UPI00140E51BB|nr:DUF1398 family protein [Flavobacterium lotistagni]NHM07851.1 DUF1398 domain-containing protein [Flavobacterium lotistagni]